MSPSNFDIVTLWIMTVIIMLTVYFSDFRLKFVWYNSYALGSILPGPKNLVKVGAVSTNLNQNVNMCFSL